MGVFQVEHLQNQSYHACRPGRPYVPFDLSTSIALRRFWCSVSVAPLPWVSASDLCLRRSVQRPGQVQRLGWDTLLYFTSGCPVWSLGIVSVPRCTPYFLDWQPVLLGWLRVLSVCLVECAVGHPSERVMSCKQAGPAPCILSPARPSFSQILLWQQPSRSSAVGLHQKCLKCSVQPHAQLPCSASRLGYRARPQ